MQRIQANQVHPLHTLKASREIEQAGLATLPPHTLMQRAGEAAARLARALAPHARTYWIACGPGNNGGDGLETAIRLQAMGAQPRVTWLGQADRASLDTLSSWHRAQAAGVRFSDAPPDLGADDLAIDALLGIGLQTGRPQVTDHRLIDAIRQLNRGPAPVLALDLPSGLTSDQGNCALQDTEGQTLQVKAQHTLSLLTLKPGLFTGHGRDVAGQVWLDTLGLSVPATSAQAMLIGPSRAAQRPHASHKGSYGDVAVLGGEGLGRRGMGMSGAAVLAAQAALHAGAGRVLLALLDPPGLNWVAEQPELMLRSPEALELPQLTVVCGCGAGQSLGPWLETVLQQAPRLVLDADALNLLANSPELQHLARQRRARGFGTVLTPHPLEAARLLSALHPGASSADVQSDRLAAAQALAIHYAATVVLKGSGTVIAEAGQPSAINPSGNARLACAGTGDVLAGWIGARLAAGDAPFEAACRAVFEHGLCADQWPTDLALTASALARRAKA